MKLKNFKLFSTLTLLALACLVASCPRNSTKASTQSITDYFQGEVYFSIDVQSLNPEMPDSVFTQFTGTDMIGYVGEDHYKVQFFSGDYLLTEVYYDLIEKKIYYDGINSDTIYWASLEKEPGELISAKRNQKEKKKIRGAIRESITITYIPIDPYLERIEGTYYFDETHKLNKSKYVNHKSNFWNLFIRESGSISIRNEVYYYPFYRATYQAHKIVERPISPKELEVPDNKIITEETLY